MRGRPVSRKPASVPGGRLLRPGLMRLLHRARLQRRRVRLLHRARLLRRRVRRLGMVAPPRLGLVLVLRLDWGVCAVVCAVVFFLVCGGSVSGQSVSGQSAERLVEGADTATLVRLLGLLELELSRRGGVGRSGGRACCGGSTGVGGAVGRGASGSARPPRRRCGWCRASTVAGADMGRCRDDGRRAGPGAPAVRRDSGRRRLSRYADVVRRLDGRGACRVGRRGVAGDAMGGCSGGGVGGLRRAARRRRRRGRVVRSGLWSV